VAGLDRREEHMNSRRIALTLTLALLAYGTVTAHAGKASELSSASRAALNKLYAANPRTKTLGNKATAILVFPKIVKAGFMVGAQGGDGAMLRGGKTIGYYRSLAGSYGFQAGMQKFGFALFFMNQAAINQMNSTGGWEIGSGPSLVVVDEGFAKSMSSNTLTSDVYAYIFDQKGLMAGIGIQGSKITRIHPK
jgi:lipid-binding SYLF domain-containing protein